MSSMVARALSPAPRTLDEAKAAGLRLVRPVRSRARKAPFVVVVMSVLGAGLVGLVLMSTVLQAQSFESARLDREAAALETRQQSIAREVDRLQSPANVASRAIAIGMVPPANPAFLRLSDGKLLGKPQAAERGSNIRSVTR
ncbi:septum formation initiator family protein [Aeromicrobium fastidiosum]|uniref:Septum formation initiator family protein n=1 Tax=Aeromicrobium fastidiosum TaxID=52699 RepID=A0A641ANH0_9ACTN|nr:septum formation initiator family protein [Aeromicrobium fastidiosum]KAA1378673.1 septum formation initiator family protein [Aeromicrobium fastidiosum]MBP2392341.1 cell division protein FtsB [Aeromicrobium fastidiosum]